MPIIMDMTFVRKYIHQWYEKLEDCNNKGFKKASIKDIDKLLKKLGVW